MAKRTRGVVYMLTGTSHAVMLTLSLRSLRRHWEGPVAIIVGCTESEFIMRTVIADDRAHGMERTIVRRWDAPTGRNSAYLAKTKLPSLSPFDETVFLDADTLVCGDVSPVFPEGGEVVLTQFADWNCAGKKMRGRIKGWHDVAPDLVERVLLHDPVLPAINTGVLGFSKSILGPNGFAESWRSLCEKKPCFICDELAAQLIFNDHQHRIIDDRYNASVVYSHKRCADTAVVWHGHGSKFYAKQTGRDIYFPHLHAGRAEDFGSMNSWLPAGDGSLTTYLAEKAAGRA